MRFDLPRKLQFLFKPATYKVAHGGRGGAKSWGFARALIAKAYYQPLTILCAREFQNSIQDSVHKLLKEQIEAMGLGPWFYATNTSITSSAGAQFIFLGIRNNPGKIKSTEGIDIAWVEEAAKVSEESWQLLIPTIRKDNSEIWVSFNPEEEDDPTYQRWVLNPPPDCKTVQINWRDNPWFPDRLRKQMEHMRSVDLDAYLHIWEGQCRKNSDAMVLHHKCTVETFTPGLDWDGPYYGADWGFSVDPTTLVKCWIHGPRLYLEHEAYAVGCELDNTPALFDEVPGSRHFRIRADSARPETIRHMQRRGFDIIGAEKGKGSVEDGIAHLRSYEAIVIHPRCEHAIEESRLWSYKTDRLTGDVLAELVDKHNHIWDAVRYALEPMIKQHGMGLFQHMRDLAEQARQDGKV
jgi:phage terminase large subunit